MYKCIADVRQGRVDYSPRLEGTECTNRKLDGRDATGKARNTQWLGDWYLFRVFYLHFWAPNVVSKHWYTVLWSSQSSKHRKHMSYILLIEKSCNKPPIIQLWLWNVREKTRRNKLSLIVLSWDSLPKKIANLNQPWCCSHVRLEWPTAAGWYEHTLKEQLQAVTPFWTFVLAIASLELGRIIDLVL